MARDNRPKGVTPNPWHAVEDIYFAALEDLSAGRRARAVRKALRLARMVEKLDPNSEALIGMGVRSLIAELDGDYDEAARYRKLELAGVKKLLEELRPEQLEWMHMDASDYSDRLDLLACLYLDAGRYDDALAALAESEAFCKKHGIPFDGKDIRADVKRAMKKRKVAV
jgi:tetratricopeptide (TPR) repeat protein